MIKYASSSKIGHLIACNLHSLKLSSFRDLPLLLKLNLFSWTENRERGEERWLTDIVRCNLGDLLTPCKFPGDAKSSKLCDFPWFLIKKKIKLVHCKWRKKKQSRLFIYHNVHQWNRWCGHLIKDGDELRSKLVFIVKAIS